MPLTAVPTAVPVAPPSLKSHRPPAAPRRSPSTVPTARYRGTAVCDDCVVSFIVGRQPDDAVVVDADEARAVRLLEQAGLVPGVRHSRQVG